MFDIFMGSASVGVSKLGNFMTSGSAPRNPQPVMGVEVNKS